MVCKTKTNGEEEVIGKWILRKAFENIPPTEIIWRRKEETDISRGTDKLSQIVDCFFENVGCGIRTNIKRDRVASLEEAYYYKMMKR